MFNHFATLLSNIDLLQLEPTANRFLLAAGKDNLLDVTNSTALKLTDTYTTLKINRIYSDLLNRNYHTIELPTQLAGVYNILFPEGSSAYYKQFLLYCYLRIISGTDKAEHVKNYDPRITYNLNEVSEYFKFNKITRTLYSDKGFELLVAGNLKPQNTLTNSPSVFIVSQEKNTANIYIYNATQREYYKAGKASTNSSQNMATALEINEQNQATTKPINLGDTGLSITLTGDFNNLTTGFTQSSNKRWAFTVESPFSFSLSEKMNDLNLKYRYIESMFEYSRGSCNLTYENMWNQHFNDTHKLTGLLLAYVERMNLLWREM
jgi:hypothetical protein